MPPVALAKSSAQAVPSRRISARDLASLTLTEREYEVLDVLSYYPSSTINLLKTKSVDPASVPSTVRQLVARALLHRHRAVYNLTRVGWALLVAADAALMYPSLLP